MSASKIKCLTLTFLLILSINSFIHSIGHLSITRVGDVYKFQSIHASFERELSEINSTAIEEFVDAFFDEELLNSFLVPGVAITFVQNNETIFTKGFGWANVSSSVPVDANETIFRAGSISKSFVATAVMQLYEKGLLELTTDINMYSPTFNISDSYPNHPITLHHLLTHTAGFDEVWNVTTSPTNISILPEFLETNLPKRIYAPGEVFCYSNYGYALAGYLVEVISGINFDQYVKINIFDPLGMNSSGFEQPFSSSHLEDFAQGYYFEDEEPIPLELYYFMAYPAGSLYTTASDMSKFIVAHLNGGVYNNSRILNTSTIQLMQSRQFTHHPQLGGYCYGFYEYIDHINQNISIIHHAGDLYGFASDLVLFPELNFGFFLSHNSVGTGFREVFLAALFDTFFPTPSTVPIPTDDFMDRKQLYQGIYWYNRYPHEKYEQGEYSDVIPYSTIELSVNESAATLITVINEQGETISVDWIEIEPFLFQLPETDTKLLLVPIDDKIQYIILGLAVYERQDTDDSSLTTTSFQSTTTETTHSKANFTNIGIIFYAVIILVFLSKRRKRKKIDGTQK